MTKKKKEPPLEPDYKYEGELQPPKDTQDLEGRIYYPYISSDDLKEAVNLAIALERPLLLEGEPGCGKTRLADAVVYEFTKKNLQKSDQQWWDYYIWNIKSTTRARDGLYRYDAIARLRDAQLMGTDPDKLRDILDEDFEELKNRLKDKRNYRKFEPLGRALGAGEKHSYRPILLIDEIDKADGDFANNLLLELEESRFEIPETGESFSPPQYKPIIFITSNREKPLPEAFLRRCIYFYVEFPKQEDLKILINKRFGDLSERDKELKDKVIDINKVIDILDEIRNYLKNNPGSKPPGTSELIDFITAIDRSENPDDDLDKLFEKMALLGILIKTKQDQDFIARKKNQHE